MQAVSEAHLRVYAEVLDRSDGTGESYKRR